MGCKRVRAQMQLQRLIPDSSDLGAGPLLVTYSSFVGQLLASNSSVQASFGTWCVHLAALLLLLAVCLFCCHCAPSIMIAHRGSKHCTTHRSWQLDDGTTNASSYLLLGAPQQLLAQLSPSWTPLMSNLSQHWIIGLQSMTVAGPNSTTLNATELGGNLTGTAGSYNRGGGQSNMGAPAMMDR